MYLERRAHLDRATARAKAVVKVGDRISATFDAGVKKTFRFKHWENGHWLCGRLISDCHAFHIYQINGQPVSFRDPIDKLALRREIEALLDLDSRGALVPHGIGGLARELFVKALAALEGQP